MDTEIITEAVEAVNYLPYLQSVIDIAFMIVVQNFIVIGFLLATFIKSRVHKNG